MKVMAEDDHGATTPGTTCSDRSGVCLALPRIYGWTPGASCPTSLPWLRADPPQCHPIPPVPDHLVALAVAGVRAQHSAGRCRRRRAVRPAGRALAGAAAVPTRPAVPA